MGATLHLIYQYRRLLEKCSSHEGLSLDEIERFSNLEDLLGERISAGRDAIVKSRRFSDPVRLEAIDRKGAICVSCPYLEEGQTIELRIDEGGRSYRFAARVQWAQEMSDDTYEVGLSFEGTPVVVRHATREIPAAAAAA